jgi:glycosyltransferase involved in cell wall biosynthesis
VVAIGRNEGERLRRCLESVLKQCGQVVYVDSGSRDGSVALARALGVEVVELDTSIPFTAARARNAGLKRLRELRPALEFVQFLDGDCELQPGWIQTALQCLRAREALAAVCGRRRERFRNATIYNRLCDIEWNTPLGEVESCGGDVLMRVAAFEQAGGFDAGLICGEEPDLCRRLRAHGHVILRIEAEMTLHDAAMTRLSQWWRRSMRTGFGAAEAWFEHGQAASRGDRRCVRGVLFWTVFFPAALVPGFVAAALSESGAVALGLALGAALLVLAQTLHIAATRDSRGENAVDAGLYALSCMAEKLPQGIGMLRCWRLRRRRIAPQLIEYK